MSLTLVSCHSLEVLVFCLCLCELFSNPWAWLNWLTDWHRLLTFLRLWHSFGTFDFFLRFFLWSGLVTLTSVLPLPFFTNATCNLAEVWPFPFFTSCVFSCITFCTLAHPARCPLHSDVCQKKRPHSERTLWDWNVDRDRRKHQHTHRQTWTYATTHSHSQKTLVHSARPPWPSYVSYRHSSHWEHTACIS